MIKIVHDDKQLCSIVNNEYIDLINNNIGVARGIPLSAYIFIIYADHIANAYMISIRSDGNKITTSSTIFKN